MNVQLHNFIVTFLQTEFKYLEPLDVDIKCGFVRQRCTGYCWSWWTGYGGERDQKKVVDDVLWCARSLVGKHCYA